MSARCSSCAARITWAVTEAGRRIPMEPSSNGAWVLLPTELPDGTLRAKYEPALPGIPTRVLR